MLPVPNQTFAEYLALNSTFRGINYGSSLDAMELPRFLTGLSWQAEWLTPCAATINAVHGGSGKEISKWQPG